MSRLVRWSKIMALLGSGGMLWMWGAGSCVPYNFYASLLGDGIIATFVSTIVGDAAAGITLPGAGT